MAFLTIIGNVGGVELKFTPGGKAVCEVSVAESHRRKDQNGQWQTESTTWRRVKFWEKHAESVANEIQKGQRVIVTGDEKLREYDRNDGTKGYSLEMAGKDIGVLVMPMCDGQLSQSAGGFAATQPGNTGWGAAPAGGAWGGQQQQGQAPPF